MSTSSKEAVTQSIVLSVRAMREADLLVTLLTASEGKMVGVAPHARRSVKRFGGALEPGLIGELVYIDRGDNALFGLQSMQRSFGPPRAARDVQVFAGLGCMLEIASLMSLERAATPEKFEVLEICLRALETKPLRAVMLYFAAHWLKVTGFSPVLDRCVRNGDSLVDKETKSHFSIADGGMVLGDGNLFFPLDARSEWLSLQQETEPSDHLPNADTCRVLKNIIPSYVEHIIGKKLKSLPFWGMVWE